MRRGDYRTAWAVSDAVLAARPASTRDDPSEPYHRRWVWDGRSFAGRRVVVRCYHGLGDTLQFCRYLAPLRAVASHVTLEVQGQLAGLLRDVRGVDVLHPFEVDAPLPEGECGVEIMELGHALRMAPFGGPYLRVDPVGEGGTGLCWAAGGWDPGRDMPAEALRPVVQQARCLSLQRGGAAKGAEVLGIVDPLEGSMDLERLAGLVAGLDAVVTIDTMVAHLAGAMGRPVFVLLQQEADWRWGSGDRSDWYGSARLVRQRRPGDWAGAVRELCLSDGFRECCSSMEQKPIPCRD